MYTVWYKEILRGWRVYKSGLSLAKAQQVAKQLKADGLKVRVEKVVGG